MMQGRVLDEGEIQNIDDQLHDAFEKRRKQEAERYLPKSEVIGICSFCSGTITLNTTWTNINPALGGNPHYEAHSECYCVECGLVFNEKIVRSK